MKKRIFKLMFALVAIATTAQAQENTIDGHEYVDLGLPSGTLWASCNVGATKPEEYGLYFAWGETKGYTSATSAGHSYWLNDEDTAHVLTELGVVTVEEADAKTLQEKLDAILAGKIEFNEANEADRNEADRQDVVKQKADNKNELDLEDDAAYVNWGSNWRMPSLDQIVELIDNCTWEWTTQNGVYGRKATSKTNGNSIFLPAAGYHSHTWRSNAGSWGSCWSRTIRTYNMFDAYTLYFNSRSVDWGSNDHFIGRSVRPVRRKN